MSTQLANDVAPGDQSVSSQLAAAEGTLDANFRSIMDSLNEGVAFADNGGLIRYANRRFIEITGYELNEILGKRIYEVYFPESTVERRNEEERMSQRWADRRLGVSEVYETLIFRKDGERRWVETKAAPLVAKSGEISGSIGAVSDITERKVLEQELQWSQKMEAVGRLAGGVAHDFNNLLTVIQGYVELLSKELERDDPHRRKIQIIQEASEAAALLTQQLLSISRRHVTRVEPLDLSEVIEGSLRVIQGITGERVQLVADLMQKPPLINGDRSQLQQILLNLVVNARDAMPDGGTLVIETTTVNRDGNEIETRDGSELYLRLRIVDTGTGMTEEVKRRIFEPFFTTKETTLGSGLGLAVTSGIVEQHRARIEVTSAIGEGTTFDVIFPTVVAQPSASATAADADSLFGYEVVLVVEDNIAVRVMLCEALDRYGYTVLQAKDGIKALETIRSSTRKIDLVITDLVMPGMNGVELAHAILGISPKTKVLTMSGCAEEHTSDGADSFPFHFLEKPFTPEKIARATRRALTTENQ